MVDFKNPSLSQLSDAPSVTNKNTKANVKEQIAAKRATLQRTGSESASLSRADIYRTPFIMSCISWLEDGRKIAFSCNPSQVQYTFAQRGGKQAVAGGQVFYFFRNKNKKSHWDLPVLNITFQTGNIRPFIDKGDDVYVPEGLSNFYEFNSLLDEVKVLPDGTPNYVTIEHHTNVFPSLYMRGFFDPEEAFTYTETVEDGNAELTWSKSFYIFDSAPGFNSETFRSLFVESFKDNYKP